MKFLKKFFEKNVFGGDNLAITQFLIGGKDMTLKSNALKHPHALNPPLESHRCRLGSLIRAEEQ